MNSDLESEIENIAYEIINKDCYACSNNLPSQKDHQCNSQFHFTMALLSAIEIVKPKYDHNDEFYEIIFEKLKSNSYLI